MQTGIKIGTALLLAVALRDHCPAGDTLLGSSVSAQERQIEGGVAVQGLEMTRSVFGGGIIYVTGGGFELSATVGQPTSGMHFGGPFELVGGFWFPIPPGDCNDDGLVNLVDYTAFNVCLTGPGGDGVNVDCAVFDVDHSGDVDLLDFAEIQQSFSGM